MTGEMCKEGVTREAFPIHFAIADKFGGTVEPFDQYQGPYIYIPSKGRVWLMADPKDEYCSVVYVESTEAMSFSVPPYIDQKKMLEEMIIAAEGILT